MKREEAAKQIAAILDKLEEGGQIVSTISISHTSWRGGLIKPPRESFAKRVEIVFSETFEGEFIVVTEPAR
jgi:hypothetical protein